MDRNLYGRNTDRSNKSEIFHKTKPKKKKRWIGSAAVILVVAAVAGLSFVITKHDVSWVRRLIREELQIISKHQNEIYESVVMDDEEDNQEETVDPDKDTGWVLRGGNWYYLDDDHEPLTDQWVDGVYYVGENGEMLRDTVTPDGRKVDKNGEVVSMTGEAYRAYYNELKKLEDIYGKTGIRSSGIVSKEPDSYKDMLGIGLIRLIDFDRDGLNEMLVGYFDPVDEQYRFRVYGYRDGKLRQYIDELMGGNGSPMVYSVGTETLDNGEEYITNHFGISKHRIYGFNENGDFVKLKDIGLREIDGKKYNDSEVARVTGSWIAYNEKNYSMTMVSDYNDRIRDILLTKRTLRVGANASKSGKDSIDKIPQDYPDKAKEYTTQQLTEEIHAQTRDEIVDYLYEDFDGDGARDMVAMTVSYEQFGLNQGITTAPDEVEIVSDFDDGYDYHATWWFTNGEETYSFYDFFAPVMTGLRLYPVKTASGTQLAATMYWRDSISPYYTPGVIINNGRTPYVIDAYGTTGRTTSTESTGIIYRFSNVEGAVELFNEEGYNFSLPTYDRIEYEHAIYNRAEDGTTEEECSYGSLRYDSVTNKWNVY
ncbi:hypothetical protein [Oribacterium sp. WCC10]|uniref:hypothetical protein n=1 Tax=Oribacterium sp. WCC10 TaxID=1855343 RepID=UPI0008E70FD2|nr:hypothetical protein [Oribacterium sp. WCC10]SFG13843.1 hypothetical protein SAMN05216356_10289 [Oribacterium sp. WCC10]